MPYRLIIAALMTLALASVCLAQPANPIVTRMGNGLTVVLQEDHAADLVGLDVWVKAGSGRENEKISGVSHFIEHLVFGSTPKRRQGEMDLEMESLGATLDARTSRDWAHFSTTVSPRYLSKALDVLADAITNSQFQEDNIERERYVILDEIAKKQANPTEVCKDYLAKELYGTHPYALPVEGTAASVKTITKKDIVDYHNKFYVPGNIAVVIVGDIDSQKAISEVGRVFQSMASGLAPSESPKEIAPPDKQVNRSIASSFKLNYIAIGMLGPKAADYADVCTTDVMLTYLGFGYRSWMETELKGKMGLALEVSADFLTQREPGMISLIAATTDANTDKAKGAIFAKIASLGKEGLTDFDLAQAKRSLLGQSAFQNETYGGRANSFGFYYAASEPEFSIKYEACVESVTNADITRVARKYLDPEHAVILHLGPSDGGQR
ncbi:MAG: insulinase family protein [Armatimonadetes bacterium]|nr:insulinase family protein [Armatimonadota bacterium]